MAGSAAAGLVWGLALALLGRWIPGQPGRAAFLVIAICYLAAELRVWQLPLPQTGRQVPAGWRQRFPQPVTAALYGALLAPGVGTRVPFPSFVGLLAASLLLHSYEIAVVAMLGYAVARASSAILAANVRFGGEIDVALGWHYRWQIKTLLIISLAGLIGAALGSWVWPS
jgi:hypothetical protein